MRANSSANADGVLSALRRAASETGTDFSYLLSTAQRESNLNPGAHAASSSATGLFQFIEQTWLGTLRQHGAEHGLKTYADAIEVGSNGRFQVTDAGMRREILALRKDPQTAALMAGEMTSETRGDMETALGRGVSAGELYVAHFLGPKAATKLIKAAEATPSASAADMFPQAAAANRSIFYGKGGEARSVSSVVAALTSKHDDVSEDGDMMLAESVTQVRPAIYEIPDAIAATTTATSNPATVSVPWVSSYGGHGMVLAPVMVQLLAALDPLPHIAAVLSEGEPKLRRTSADLI